MKKTRPIVLALALLAGALPASAATLVTPPIEVDGENRCLECLIANVGNDVVKVDMDAFAEDGTPTDLGVEVLEPGESTFWISNCGADGNFTCQFDMLHGSTRDVRAAACEFTVTMGCRSAVAAN